VSAARGGGHTTCFRKCRDRKHRSSLVCYRTEKSGTAGCLWSSALTRINATSESGNYSGYNCSNHRVHNSRRPLDRLQYVFVLCDPVTMTFDLPNINSWPGLVMDYFCSKFGDCSFSCFGFIVRTDRHTDSHTDAGERITPATVVGVSKYV